MRNPAPVCGAYPVNDRVIYAEQHGIRRAGQPVIIVEVGSTQAGTKDRGWWPVRDTLAQEAQVVFYDRAGLGGSSPVAQPRPISAFTADLRGLVQAARIDPPYLLLGGSFSGLIVTHYAALYPGEVAGILLEDSTHPEHNPRTLALLPKESAGESLALKHFRDYVWTETYAPLETNEQEGLDFITSMAEMRAAWDLGDIPLTVLTAGQDTWEEGFPMDVAERYEALWMVLQQELARRSKRSKQRIIAESGHVIHDEAPEAVITAVREMLAAALA